jgi:hypothetical protein
MISINQKKFFKPCVNINKYNTALSWWVKITIEDPRTKIYQALFAQLFIGRVTKIKIDFEIKSL